MTIKKKFGTGAVFATILLAAILLVPVVSAQGNEITQENATVKLTFGPETLDKLKSDPDCIAVYGNIPAFTTMEERKQWIDKLNNVYQGAISEMSKYESPNGPVTSFGYTIDGVLEVGFNKTVEKPFMDEIYKIFDSKASLIGIKEVPVVFVHQDLAVPTIKPIVRETANLSTSGEKSTGELNSLTNNDSNSINESISNISNSSGNKSSKINSIPGFELLGSLTCLYGGWKLRKK